MTTSPTPVVVPPPKGQRRWLKPVLFTVGGILLLVVGIVIGSVSQQSTINSYKHQVAQLQSQVSTDKSNLAAEQTKVSTAQTDAQNALATARAQVNAQYKSKFAALQAQKQKVAGLQAKLNRELGVVAKSTINEDGVYVVGKDIPAGTYHTSGGAQCYYATLGSTDTSNILDNNNFNGPETVDVSAAFAFQIQGGCTWHRE
jgi:hypothetical protein